MYKGSTASPQKRLPIHMNVLVIIVIIMNLFNNGCPSAEAAFLTGGFMYYLQNDWPFFISV